VRVIESIGIVGMSTSGVDVPAALILSTVFISALALGTLTGGIVAMRSSRALTFLLSVASGDRPQQGLSRPVRSGRKGSKRYSPQFKADAVQMVVTSTKTVAEVARSLGANPSTLGKWVARHRAEHSDHRVQRQG
jgi:hypothetical protein